MNTLHPHVIERQAMEVTGRAAVIPTPIGELTLVAGDDGLRQVRFGAVVPDDAEEVDLDSDEVLVVAARQLTEYLAGDRQEFDLPLDRSDLSVFARSVSDAMLAIPYGYLRSYGDLAGDVGRPGGAQAVGGACNANPLPIIVPCHRVTASDGSLGGYAGGLNRKRWLLRLERPGAPVPDGGWGDDEDRQPSLPL